MKKERERFFLDAFIERRLDLGILNPCESESPDFICTASGVRIGIEVTQFYFPSESKRPPQAIDAYRGKLTCQLQELHKIGDYLPVHVSIHFWSEENLLTAPARRLLAERILSFVAVHIPPIGPHVEHRMDDEAVDLLDMGVDSIIMIRTASLTKGTYAIGHGAFIPESRSNLIQDILDQKASLIPEYRKKAKALWLLILSGTGGLHSIIDFDRDVLTAEYSTEFDRVFVFRTFGPHIHELKKRA
jgi:hypothetical protein